MGVVIEIEDDGRILVDGQALAIAACDGAVRVYYGASDCKYSSQTDLEHSIALGTALLTPFWRGVSARLAQRWAP